MVHMPSTLKVIIEKSGPVLTFQWFKDYENAWKTTKQSLYYENVQGA